MKWVSTGVRLMPDMLCVLRGLTRSLWQKAQFNREVTIALAAYDTYLLDDKEFAGR